MATKTHYKVSQKLEPFYAGGALSLSKSGELIACAYYDEVKVSINDSNSSGALNRSRALRSGSRVSVLQVVQSAPGSVLNTFTGVRLLPMHMVVYFTFQGPAVSACMQLVFAIRFKMSKGLVFLGLHSLKCCA